MVNTLKDRYHNHTVKICIQVRILAMVARESHQELVTASALVKARTYSCKTECVIENKQSVQHTLKIKRSIISNTVRQVEKEAKLKDLRNMAATSDNRVPLCQEMGIAK